MKVFKDNSAITAHIRGNLYALVLTLTSVLILALVIKYAGLPSEAIKPITQIIKVTSIFVGVFIILRRTARLAWLHGAVFGLIYTALAFFLFSVIDTNFSITAGLFIDMLFATLVGVISAVLLRLRRRNV